MNIKAEAVNTSFYLKKMILVEINTKEFIIIE
jgi:hypothetical protein